MKGSLYIQGKSFGEFEITRPTISHAFVSPHWFCPRCGEEWARVVPDLPTLHQFHSLKCPSCGGGSLILWGNYPLDSLSSLALAREINLLLTLGDSYEQRRN